jgi:hypothetical protein
MSAQFEGSGSEIGGVLQYVQETLFLGVAI